MITQDVISCFFRHFRVVPADNLALLREVYRMRYEVYCLEKGFEPPEAFPEGLEFDDFDGRSRHCLLQHRASGRYAGCVRLILQDPIAPESPLPFERYCGHSLDRRIIDPATLPRASFGEISRLTVPAAFRRRAGEAAGVAGETGPALAPSREDRRAFSHIAVGLYLAGAALGLREGLAGVFVMMEPRLARHLALYDIQFTPVGEVVDYHGRRGPYYIAREGLLDGLSAPLAELLARIRADLERPSRPTPRSDTAVLLSHVG